MSPRVAVVGGGFSGLTAAHLLERVLGEGADVLVLEASGRLGGRIRTSPIDGSGLTYDSGAAEFYDIEGSPELRNLVDHLGLAAEPLEATPTFRYAGEAVATEDDLARVLGAGAVRELASFWREAVALRPVGNYAEAGSARDNRHPWQRVAFSEVLARLKEPGAASFTAVQVHSDLATEPTETSGLFGLDNLLVDHPAYMSMYTLRGGNESLVRALAARIRAPVLTSAPVRHVEALREGGFEVRYERGGIARTARADAVLLTQPPLQLGWVSAGPGPLSRALASHVAHHDHPAGYLRVTAAFRSAFWRDAVAEDYLVSDSFGGVTVYDKSPRGPGSAGILSWLIAGRNAAELAESADGAVVERALDSLPFLGARARGELLAAEVDRWTGPLGVSRLPGGVPLRSLEARHRPSPKHPGLLVAGDYLFDSTVCGALDSVLHAVGRIRAHIEGADAGDLRDHPSLAFLRRPHHRSRRRPGAVLPFLTTA